jgi:hypothetical protein
VELTVGRATGKQVAGRAYGEARIGGKSAVPERELLLWARSSPFAKMNRVFLLLIFAIFVASGGVAQTPANLEAKLLALVKDVQTQQAQLAANQAKIEEKLAAVTESVRTARIYTKRER